jgi:ubiquinone/menaquinone biosynthesis C-methylase UbiE
MAGVPYKSIVKNTPVVALPDTHKQSVIQYYDTHPINEEQILIKLRARGDDFSALTQDQLKDFDQDHYGGVQAVDELARLAGIGAQHHILDVCSGMGGPARWLAHSTGCRVTGLDFTLSRVEAARRLTQMTKLDARVDFVQGDATQMPLPAQAFDAAISQEAWLHIPDKGAVLSECARVLKPGGVLAFTDVVVRQPLSAHEYERMANGQRAPDMATVERYRELLAANRFVVESMEDLSARWTAILIDRLAMYRSLRDTTVAKFGEARHAEWDSVYSLFVGLFEAGKLGGVRILARAPS